jgi:hypothetical protein
MVATRRRALRRSGAMVTRARQAPLNSSISAISARNSGVIAMVSVLNISIPSGNYMVDGVGQPGVVYFARFAA